MAPGRLSELLHNTVYIGHHVYRSKRGEINHEVPALVDKYLFEAAQAQLTKNLSRPKARERVNLLNGLVRCNCRASYVSSRGQCGVYIYRCTGALPTSQPDPAQRRRAIQLRAHDLENYVWGNCEAILKALGFILRSGQAIIETYA